MRIQLSKKPRTVKREVTVIYPGVDPRATKKEKFVAEFKVFTNDEIEDLRNLKMTDTDYVSAITSSVEIELEKEDGTIASPEETLKYACNDSLISAALISTFNDLRNKNLKS